MDKLSYFISDDFLVTAVIGAVLINLINKLLGHGARAGARGLSSWVRRISRRRRVWWWGRVRMYLRFREAYELSRHVNSSAANAGNFLYVAGLLLYVGGGVLMSTSLVWVMLGMSLFFVFGAAIVDHRASRAFDALNSAGLVYVRREMRSKILGRSTRKVVSTGLFN